MLRRSAAAAGALAHAPLPCRRRRGVAAEELRLGEHRLLELVEQHALVRRVDVGEAVRRPEQQHLGVGHRLLQRVHERDRAARCEGHRLAAPRARERVARRLVRRPGGRRREARAGLPACTVSDDAERPQPLEVGRSARACASTGSCSGWTRRLSFARAYGTTALTALSTGSTSIPVTVTAGPDQIRSPRPPVPKNGTPGAISASSRNSSSL